ncbi:hypothetical protein [Leptothrix discophora]|uniref:Uncharacterized protein n=1 Tax=Leptothrix discophora TaxID=89 RepID=A0ABT9FZD7_LEPDI|nr:hypothetical protein [Leptothrix discophora]MDP4299592.1 hypothetical protein [Leptothrix discophora]
MRTMRLGAIAGGLLIGTALVALAAERVVTLWQAPEAARLAGASADIRLLLAGAVVAWSLAIAVALLHLLSRQDRIAEQEARLGRMLSEQEVHLAARCRELSAQLMHSREVVMNDMVSLDTAQQHRQGLQEMRFASLEASLKRIDDTLTDRLEGLAVLVSHQLQASSSRLGEGAGAGAGPALEAQFQRIDRHIEQRFDELESRMTQSGGLTGPHSGLVDFDPFSPVATKADDRVLRELAERVGQIDGRLEQIAARAANDVAELGAMLVRMDRRMEHPAMAGAAADVAPLLDAALKRTFESLGRRLDGIEVWLRQHGQHVGMAFTDLSQRLDERSVNNSVFGDFAPGSSAMPLEPTPAGAASAGGAGSLQSLMLNLAHLQVDLRAERSQLRKRLRDLGGDLPPSVAAGA